MKTFLLFVFFTGLILVVIHQLINTPQVKVEYRYLPRDLDLLIREESQTPANFANIFETDIWVDRA
jgi:hypothetical protein